MYILCTCNVHLMYGKRVAQVQSTSLRRQNAVKGSKNEQSHYKTRQEKTRQDKTRQDKRRLDKEREEKKERTKEKAKKKPDGRVRGSLRWQARR